MKLSNKLYDVLKWFALIALDAIGLFYNTIATIWGFPYGDQVLATFAACSLLLGTLIGVSSVNYNKTNA